MQLWNYSSSLVRSLGIFSCTKPGGCSVLNKILSRGPVNNNISQDIRISKVIKIHKEKA